MLPILDKFRQLFIGGDQAHGEWHPNQQKGSEAVTRHTPASAVDYANHLDGTIGLGLVPVQSNGLCRFAAIDLDIDTIDHARLYVDVASRKIPLHVCRSKSGGAHLYAFFREPGLPATAVQSLLKRWAQVLGYPTAEIFPKQTRVGPQNVGSWINLPYFGADATTRYAIGPDGSLGLDDFLNSVRYYDAATTNIVEAEDAGRAQLPPCLKKLQEIGLGEGYRNQGLFNFAVFYRKSDPANWEQRLLDHNRNFVSPSLPDREIRGVIGSAARTKYQYTCEQSPIRDYCDADTCRTLKFGVGHKPWDESDAFEDVVISNLKRISSDPPVFVFDVNGREIESPWEVLYNFKLLRSLIGERLSMLISPMKQPQWETQLRDLLEKRQDIDAPEDASTSGLVLSKFHEFLGLRERAINKEDIARGIPVQDGAYVLFRAGDFKHYLQAHKLDKLEIGNVFNLLRKDGCVHRSIEIGKRNITVWAYPLAKINEQTGDFTIADFQRDLGHEEL